MRFHFLVRNYSSSAIPLSFQRIEPLESNTKLPLVVLHGLLGNGMNFNLLSKQPSIRQNSSVIRKHSI